MFNREQTYEARWRTAAGVQKLLRVIVTSPNLQGRAVAALPDGDAVVVWKDAGELYGRVAFGPGGLGPVRKISTGGEVIGRGRPLRQLVGHAELGEGADHVRPRDAHRMVEQGHLGGNEAVGQRQEAATRLEDCANGERGRGSSGQRLAARPGRPRAGSPRSPAPGRRG